MQWARLSLFVSLFALIGGGCTTGRFTNLTPSELPRKADGLYPFEFAFSTRQRSLEKDTIDAYVVVDENLYPMTRTEMVEDRWETLVPVDPETNKLYYRYKIEYLYKAIPEKKRGSKMSPPYQLEIVDEF